MTPPKGGYESRRDGRHYAEVVPGARAKQRYRSWRRGARQLSSHLVSREDLSDA